MRTRWPGSFCVWHETNAGPLLTGASDIAAGTTRETGGVAGFGALATTGAGLGAGLVTFSCAGVIDIGLLGSDGASESTMGTGGGFSG